MTEIPTELLKKLSSGIDFDKNAKDARDSLIKSKEQVRESGYIDRKISSIYLKNYINDVQIDNRTHEILQSKRIGTKELQEIIREHEKFMEQK